MTMLADISNNNGQTAGVAAIDDKAIAAVYAKATQGVTFKDPLWPVFRAAAKKAKKPIGAYAFLDPSVPGAKQATYLLGYAKPLPGDLQPVIDSETWGSTHLETAQVTYDALAALHSRGYAPIGYGSQSFWATLVAEVPQLKEFRYWEADYAPKPTPVPGLETVLWQWTDAMPIDGGRFKVDGDRLLAPSLEALVYKG